MTVKVKNRTLSRFICFPKFAPTIYSELLIIMCFENRGVKYISFSNKRNVSA